MSTRRLAHVPLSEIAAVVRSKNSGPFVLTLDVIFRDPEHYFLLNKKQFLTPELTAGLYHIAPEDVFKVMYFDAAFAAKATMKRATSSGAIGDTDICEAQQHAPLLGSMIDA